MVFEQFYVNYIKNKETKKLFKTTIIISFIFIFFCVILLFLARLYLPVHLLSTINFSSHLEYNYYAYFLIFIITLLGGTFFPVGSPAIVATAGVLGMPKLPVVLISTIGYTIGTSINYLLAYELGIHYVQRKIGKEVYEDLTEWWNKWGTILVVSFALLPILPFNLLALLCGLFRYRFIYFFLINFGSNLLTSYIFVYIGSSAASWIGLF